MILREAKRACYYIILPILPISILPNTTYFGQYYTILRILLNTTQYGRSNLQMPPAGERAGPARGPLSRVQPRPGSAGRPGGPSACARAAGRDRGTRGGSRVPGPGAARAEPVPTEITRAGGRESKFTGSFPMAHTAGFSSLPPLLFYTQPF